MIDVHSHVLPAIDDGAGSLDESLQLIERAASSGVRKIIATPHMQRGRYDNDIASIAAAYQQLTTALAAKPEINIELAYGAEVHLCPEIMILVKQQALPFIGRWQGKDVLLLELPSSHVPPGSEKLIDWLAKQNIVVLIAHPERYRYCWPSQEVLRPFLRRGCLMQLTASSLLGDFGEQAEHSAWQMIEREQVLLVASDMHNLRRRPCKMAEAYEAVAQRCGDTVATQLFVTHGTQIFDTNPTRWTHS